MKEVTKRSWIVPVFCFLSLLLITTTSCQPTIPDLCGPEGCLETEDHPTMTDEGHRIVLTRWPPVEPARESPPILFCAGTGVNTLSYIYIAEYLAGEGIDVWAVDYWGRGKSQAGPDELPLVAQRSQDEVIHYDTVAAIRYIREHTGFDEIFISGLSQGGLVTLVIMEFYSDWIRGGIPMAPGILVGGVTDLVYLFWEVPLLNIFLPTQYFPEANTIFPVEETVSGVMGLLQATNQLDLLVSEPMRILLNPDNYTAEWLEKLAFHVISDFVFNEIIQFSRGAGLIAGNGVWNFRGSDFYKEHGLINYASSVSRISKPCLLVAGGADVLVPWPNVEKVFEKMTGCPDKSFLVLSRKNGFGSDYAHADPILGLPAREEFFPILLEWILTR